MSPLLISLQQLSKQFYLYDQTTNEKGVVDAVNDVDLDILSGETLGLVGESGCGKSTLGRCILRLIEPTAGKIIYEDQNLLEIPEKAFKPYRKKMQIVFQDPFASLNPRKSIRFILEEPLIIHGMSNSQDRKNRLDETIDKVGLTQDDLNRYPHEFSGGQRQRIGIARALILKPDFIVCDEPVSALDVSIQAQILNLLIDLQQEMRLTYLFISHDLSVVKHISNRIAVMYLGRIVEIAPTEEIFENPLHPYTTALLSSIPAPDPTMKKDRLILEGDPPSPLNPPTGCRFHTRCPQQMDICSKKVPERKAITSEHHVYCHLYNDLGNS
ncbi:MAG TPA: dipeptide ABC transporter ATP-binding protein [Candidatus Atribacteria bacterium]|jgi:oligopeptide transport system ATP-binding protein|uniref:Oligopeptide transport ATP-binding protein OppF n=1 Tax=Atribacter laminatus TaxID=2847778 RepID=A0A7T1AP31_ATRLM|nr:dipeptide ABC transporter ATP-binding protein [Atribacter laminatus]QPM69472.1 Oligopeptide transport ATP-binding protein OppF [Atribacter laminatus]HHT09642.1 dipeptide ABC transporter ATP-binding protein [Candidatus Atribacteria bacterium]